MDQLWCRLWQAVQTACPDLRDDEIPGVPPESWEPFEERLGRSLPESFKAFYAIRDGLCNTQGEDRFGWILGHWELFSQEHVIGRWEAWHDIVEEHSLEELREDFDDCISRPPNAIKEQYACDSWVPFGADYSGNCIGVDLDPEPNGTVGQVITFGRDTPTKHVLARDFADFMEWFVLQIEAGRVAPHREDGLFGFRFPNTENFPTGYLDGRPLAQACHRELGFAESN